MLNMCAVRAKWAWVTASVQSPPIIEKCGICGGVADALIAAGIGNVSEWKHRAEVAERALDKATELAYTYRTQDDTFSCSYCPFDSIFDRCKERGLYEDCSKRWKEELLQQAEKELQEERDEQD